MFWPPSLTDTELTHDKQLSGCYYDIQLGVHCLQSNSLPNTFFPRFFFIIKTTITFQYGNLNQYSQIPLLSLLNITLIQNACIIYPKVIVMVIIRCLPYRKLLQKGSTVTTLFFCVWHFCCLWTSLLSLVMEYRNE